MVQHCIPKLYFGAQFQMHNLKGSLIAGDLFICSTLVVCLECQDLV